MNRYYLPGCCEEFEEVTCFLSFENARTVNNG